MRPKRLLFAIYASALCASSVQAEPAVTISVMDLRSTASAGGTVVAKIPAGVAVQATRCQVWCAVEWQGRKAFAVASSLKRGPDRTADPYANGKEPVPM